MIEVPPGQPKISTTDDQAVYFVPCCSKTGEHRQGDQHLHHDTRGCPDTHDQPDQLPQTNLDLIYQARKGQRLSGDHPQAQQYDQPPRARRRHGYDTSDHDQKAPSYAKQSPKVGPTPVGSLAAVMVVLKAVAGLTLLEAPPVFLRPFDHTSTFYEYGQPGLPDRRVNPSDC